MPARLYISFDNFEDFVLATHNILIFFEVILRENDEQFIKNPQEVLQKIVVKEIDEEAYKLGIKKQNEQRSLEQSQNTKFLAFDFYSEKGGDGFPDGQPPSKRIKKK